MEDNCTCSSHQQPACAYWRGGYCPDKPAPYQSRPIDGDHHMTEVQKIVSDILLFRARIDEMAAGLIKFVKPREGK